MPGGGGGGVRGDGWVIANSSCRCRQISQTTPFSHFQYDIVVCVNRQTRVYVFSQHASDINRTNAIFSNMKKVFL